MEAVSNISDENDKNDALAAQSMAMASLSDFLVHHTWSVRTLSPFAVPLDLRNGTASIEDKMTKFLRTQRVAMDSEPGFSDRPLDDEGTFVSLFWSVATGNEESTEGSSTSRENLKRKKVGDLPSDEQQAMLDNNQESFGQGGHDRHLIIDARVQDEQSAQIVLCYPRFSQKNNGGGSGVEIMEGFDFCLARGSKSSYEILFGWLETFTGCIVAKAPFTPSAADLSKASTIWTTKHWQKNRPGQSTSRKDKDTEESDNATKITSKPLTLTFAVPPNLCTSGLDTISLNIPPVALMRLCSDMMVSRHRKRSIRCEDDDGLGEAERSVAGEEPLPVLKALQSFIQETLHINIKPFSLIRTSCSVASFGRDGRCKPHCPFFLGEVLQEIQYMTLNRSPSKEGPDDPATLLAAHSDDEQ